MQIRQSYIDVTTGRKQTKEIEIRLEDTRTLNSTTFSEANLVAFYDEEMVSTCAHDKILALLDAKRTNLPNSTYLIAPSEDNVIRVDKVNFNVGDPLAIMADIHGNNIQYGIVTAIDHDMVTLSNTINKLYGGAIVQNLANRWLGDQDMGVCARLSRPEPLSFTVNTMLNVRIHVTIPMNGVIKYYDVYIRNRPFSNIAHHWLPDVTDINIDIPVCEVTTYNGGAVAGGDLLHPGTYYATVISKDGPGRVNVNESECVFVEKFQVIK